ncbi:MAG: hypothetical protein ACFB0A_02385 [Croceivirga sp.]
MKKESYLFIGLCLFLSVFMVSCGSEDEEPETDGMDPPDMPIMSETVIWNGSSLTFQKAAGSDPSAAANQDRITDNVWITRGNDGGQIFNAFSESQANSASSPEGTLWALGTTDDIENLQFDRFRNALGKPKDRVNEDLVLLLVDDNIAIDVRITAWPQGQVGGFTYVRSTEP